MEQQVKVKIASSQAHYQKYGLQKGVIAPWEDGMRTSGEAGIFEWWYFDVNFEDNATLVVTFFTKPLSNPEFPLTPMINVEFNGADGTKVSKVYTASEADFSAAKDRCYVQIGPNRFRGDLNHYSIHLDLEEIQADVDMTGIVPSWRPETGIVLYGAEEQDYYGWLVAVPKGRVHADITIDGVRKGYDGYGYHDHNWGNKSLMELKHHGYWGRAEVDGYTMINAINYAPKAYDGQAFQIFMLAKGARILADDSNRVTFAGSEEFVDEPTGKPLSRTTTYTYQDGKTAYRVTYQIEDIIFRDIMGNALSEKERQQAPERDFHPVYFRFYGTITLEILEEERLMERHAGKGMWESMYFGNPQDQIG